MCSTRIRTATGFSVLDDWKNVKGDGSDSIDPQDKNVHPPYWTKLRFIQYIKQPFRLLFNAYDGDVKKPGDAHIPDQYGGRASTEPVREDRRGDRRDQVQGHRFRVQAGAKSGDGNHAGRIRVDCPEHRDGDNVTLVLEKIVDSPDSYALFNYLWNNKQFKVKKGKEFVLLPEASLRYKLIDITEHDALIETPTSHQIRIPLTR